MVNARLEREEKRLRQASRLETIPGIIANDGATIYTSRAGFVRVQVRKGETFLPARAYPNKTSLNLQPGLSVRLGIQDGEWSIVGVDDQALRSGGQNPAAARLPDRNAEGYTNQAGIPVLKIIPTSPISTSLVVLPGWVQRADGLTFFAGQAVSLSSAISALSSGEHQLVGFYLLADDTIETTTSTAQSTADPIDATDITEAAASATPGAMPLGFWKIQAGMTDINSDAEYLDARQFVNGPHIVFSTVDVSSPPTDAELDAEFGPPATVGAGFVAVIDDNGAGSAGYLAWSDGSNWWYAAGTKAT